MILKHKRKKKKEKEKKIRENDKKKIWYEIKLAMCTQHVHSTIIIHTNRSCSKSRVNCGCCDKRVILEDIPGGRLPLFELLEFET